MISVKNIDYYMALNYSVQVDKFDEESEKYFRLSISILPGLEAYGETLPEAYEDLQEAKKEWFLDCLDDGIAIPEPVTAREFSGRVTLRMPKTMHQILTDDADKEGISLNSYIVTLLEQNNTLKSSETITRQLFGGVGELFNRFLFGGVFKEQNKKEHSFRIPVSAMFTEEKPVSSVISIEPVTPPKNNVASFSVSDTLLDAGGN